MMKHAMSMPRRCQRIWHRRMGVVPILLALFGIIPFLGIPCCCFAFETKEGRGSIPLATAPSGFGGVFGGGSSTKSDKPRPNQPLFEVSLTSADKQTGRDKVVDNQRWGAGSLPNEKKGRGAHLKRRKSSSKVKKPKIDPCDIFPQDGRLQIQCKQMGMSMMASMATMKQRMMMSSMHKRKEIANVDTPVPSDIPSSQPSFFGATRAPHPPASPTHSPPIQTSNSPSPFAPSNQRPPSQTSVPGSSPIGATTETPERRPATGAPVSSNSPPGSDSPPRAVPSAPASPPETTGEPTDSDGDRSNPTSPVSNENTTDSTGVDGRPVGSVSTARPTTSDATDNAPPRSSPTRTAVPTATEELGTPRNPPSQSSPTATAPPVSGPTTSEPLGGNPTTATPTDSSAQTPSGNTGGSPVATTPSPGGGEGRSPNEQFTDGPVAPSSPGSTPRPGGGGSPMTTRPTFVPNIEPNPSTSTATPAPSSPNGEPTDSPVVPPSSDSTPGPGGGSPITSSPTVAPGTGPNPRNPVTDSPTISPITPSPVSPGSGVTNAPSPAASRLPTNVAPVQPPNAETQPPAQFPVGTLAPSPTLAVLTATPTLSTRERLIPSAPFSIVFSLPVALSSADATEDFVGAQTRVLEFYDSFFRTFFEDRDETTLLNFDGEILESDPTVPSATFLLHLTFDPESEFIPTEQEIDIFAEIATFEEPFRQDFLDALDDLGEDNLFSQTENLQFVLRPELATKNLAFSSIEGALQEIQLDPFIVKYAVHGTPTDAEKNMTSQMTIALIDEFFEQWFDKVHPGDYGEIIGERIPRLESKPSQIAFLFSIEGSSSAMQSLGQKELETLLLVAFDPPYVDSLLRILGSLPSSNPYNSAESIHVKFIREQDNEVLRRAAAAAVAALSLLVFSTIAFLGNRCWPRGQATIQGKDEVVNEKLLHGDTSHYSAEESTRHDLLQYTGDWDRDEHIIEFTEGDSDDPLLWPPNS